MVRPRDWLQHHAAERSGIRCGSLLSMRNTRREGLDGAAQRRRGHRAGGFEMRRKGEVGIGVQITVALEPGASARRPARPPRSAPAFREGSKMLTSAWPRPELVAFLRLAHAVVAPHVLERHHAGERCVNLKLVDVAEGAFQATFWRSRCNSRMRRRRHRTGRGRRWISSGWRRARGAASALTSFLRRSISASSGPLRNSSSALARSASAACKSEARFSASARFCAALLDLVAEVVELGLGVAGVVEFLGAVEFGEQVAFLHADSARDDLGERDAATLIAELRSLHGVEMHRLDGSREADFVRRGWLAGRLGLGFRGGGADDRRRISSTRRRKGEQGTPQRSIAGRLHGAAFRKLVRRRRGGNVYRLSKRLASPRECRFSGLLFHRKRTG